jgi:hypothetical protein
MTSKRKGALPAVDAPAALAAGDSGSGRDSESSGAASAGLASSSLSGGGPEILETTAQEIYTDRAKTWEVENGDPGIDSSDIVTSGHTVSRAITRARAWPGNLNDPDERMAFMIVLLDAKEYEDGGKTARELAPILGRDWTTVSRDFTAAVRAVRMRAAADAYWTKSEERLQKATAIRDAGHDAIIAEQQSGQIDPLKLERLASVFKAGDSAIGDELSRTARIIGEDRPGPTVIPIQLVLKQMITIEGLAPEPIDVSVEQTRDSVPIFRATLAEVIAADTIEDARAAAERGIREVLGLVNVQIPGGER